MVVGEPMARCELIHLPALGTGVAGWHVELVRNIIAKGSFTLDA